VSAATNRAAVVVLGEAIVSRLTAVKLAHTAVWVFFVTCIAGIPLAAAVR
jgi:hypothetical protein